MVIDATEAVGVFAANEPNDGDPNLICIGVSLPNPLNDDGERMVYAVFTQRKIPKGTFGTLCYGLDYSRDHYPDKGRAIIAMTKKGGGAPKNESKNRGPNETDLQEIVCSAMKGYEEQLIGYAAFYVSQMTPTRLGLSSQLAG